MLQPGAKVRHGLGREQQRSIYNTPCAFVFVSLQTMKMWGRVFFFFFFLLKTVRDIAMEFQQTWQELFWSFWLGYFHGKTC